MTIYAKAFHKKKGSVWKEIDPLYVRGAGGDPDDASLQGWLQVAKAWTKWDGVWRLVYPDVAGCYYLPSSTNLNLAGWLANQGAPAGEDICVILPAGNTIGGTVHGQYAFNAGNISIYNSVTVNIDGEVQGKGGVGAGGSSALYSNYPITIILSDTGAIRGGGGAGGRGGDGGAGWAKTWSAFQYRHKNSPDAGTEYYWRNPTRVSESQLLIEWNSVHKYTDPRPNWTPYSDAIATGNDGLRYKRGALKASIPAYKVVGDPSKGSYPWMDERYEVSQEQTTSGVGGKGGGGGRGRGYNQGIANGANGTLGTFGAGDGGKGGTGGGWAIIGSKGANGTAGDQGSPGATGLNGFAGGNSMRLKSGSLISSTGSSEINGSVVEF